MKFAYLLYGIRLRMLFRLIRKNRFPLRSPYIFRFLFLFQNACWSSLFSRLEKIQFKKIIQSTPLPEEPIIIIGNWRTGSTYLHQLLQYDPQRAVPNYFHVHLPDSFLFAGKFYKPIMRFFMGKNAKRPFDNVSVCADEPQEDEFALLKMCGHSPLVKLLYPDSNQFFLLNYENFELEGKEYDEWKSAMVEFCKKLKIATSKQIILKNPFHSQRIITIKRLFPRAKFIHIYRNPYNVIPSTINMWNIVGKQNSMVPGFVPASVKDAVEVFDRTLTYIQIHTQDLPQHSFCEIRYEDLEKNPLKEIRNAYAKLNLMFSAEFEESILKHQVNNYKKNKYYLSKEDKNYITSKLKHHLERYGYCLTPECFSII